MKNIKAFESYNVIDMERNEPIKKYGESFPLTNLKIGDKVTYLGGPFIVDKVDEYSLLLKSVEDGSIIRVNQNMFNQRAYIGFI
ncbi:MAG: hypothetical protein EBS19_09025 [Spirochaetia bacterium]|nr:hypothetical protein [Spirochaetia bacterium]